MKKNNGIDAGFWFGVALLAGLLCLSLWTGLLMEKNHGAVAQKLEQAAQMAFSGELDSGKKMAQQARTKWESCHAWTAAAADQTPMDNIDELFGQLQVYETHGTAVEFAACCRQLSKLVRSVADAHKLAWWNIL